MFDGSPETDKVIPAFVKALAEMDDVTQNKKVEAGPMRYKYADLAAVLDATRPALRTHGLGLSQYPSGDGITTVIFHESGQYLTFPALLIEPASRDPQKVGSAISYARRYSILSILGLATEDDDGRKASEHTFRPDPLKARIDNAVEDMRGLPDDEKEALKEWAASEGQSLSPKALAADLDWLVQVEEYLSMVIAGIDVSDDGSGD